MQLCDVANNAILAIMDKISLTRKATYLRGAVAMGGFVITMKQAERAVLCAEENQRWGKSLTFEQAREEVRQLTPPRQQVV